MTATRTLRQTATVLIGAGLLSAEAAWLHMRGLAQTYGVICGSGAGAMAHCPACYTSVFLLASGAAAFALAQAGGAATLQARPIRSA